MKIFIQTIIPFVFFGFTLSFIGCSSFDEPEEIPTYINIDTIKLETNAPLHGSPSHKITDAWIFVNGQLIGAYKTPATVPVLASGEEQEVVVFGGILENGILSTRDVYPFYDRYRIITDLPAGGVTTIQPTLTYSNKAEFSFIEDFETSNRFGVDLDGDANTFIAASGHEKFEGNKSGYVLLQGDNRVFEATSNLFYDIGEIGQPIYLEFDYKSDIPFEVGIIGLKGGLETKVYKLGINSRENWNKIYISMTEEVGVLNAESYKITFRAIKPNDTETAELFFDNIKLIHF